MARTAVDLELSVLKTYLQIALKQRQRAATTMKTNYSSGDQIAKLLGSEIHELEQAIANMTPIADTPSVDKRRT